MQGVQESVKTVTIGGNISSIKSNAFYKYGTLTDVTIGESVQEIGTSAFRSAFRSVNSFYCPIEQEQMCRDAALRSGLSTSIIGTYSKKNGYITYYDANGEVIKTVSDPSQIKHRIYTVNEAIELTKKANKFNFSLKYR